MSLLYTINHPKSIQDVLFHQAKSGEEYLLVASEYKKVNVYSTNSEDSTSLPIIAEAIGHQNRYAPFQCTRSISLTSTLTVIQRKSIEHLDCCENEVEISRKFNHDHEHRLF